MRLAAIVAASGFGSAARRLLPTALLVDPKPTDRRVNWPPPGQEDEWRRVSDACEQAFAENGQRAVFDCRYLAATEGGRTTGLLGLSAEGTGVRASFSGGILADGDTTRLLADRALGFYGSQLPGLTAVVGGVNMACPRCGSRDAAKMILNASRDEAGKLDTVMLCAICAKTWRET